MALRAEHVSQLTEPDFLGTIVGEVKAVEHQAMGTSGFSGSTHERYVVTRRDGDVLSLVLKRTQLDRDWTAYRSADRRGREAMLLASPEMARVWDAFATPFVAYAIEEGAIALLMHDLAPFLLRDVREPLASDEEESILGQLASLHASYWNDDLTSCGWLARPAQALGLLGPRVLDENGGSSPVESRAREGWAEALRRLPSATAAFLRASPEEHEARFAHLPHTLFHGDVKVANFAFVPGGRVAAFDWALVGNGPAAIDLGWYLTVNATRLTGTKEELIRRYRALLEARLGRAFAEPEWRDQERLAILGGSLTLLWSKALAVRDGRPGALEEWSWWVERLEALR